MSLERNKVFVIGDVNGASSDSVNNTSSSRVMIGSSSISSVSNMHDVLGTPMHVPSTPGEYSDSNAAWDPKASVPNAIPTPAASGLSRGLPTPAMFSSSSSYTPKTPATPATPAAASASNTVANNDPTQVQEGDNIVVVSGEHTGKIGKVQGIDETEAIVILHMDGDQVLKIISLADINKT